MSDTSYPWVANRTNQFAPLLISGLFLTISSVAGLLALFSA